MASNTTIRVLDQNQAAPPSAVAEFSLPLTFFDTLIMNYEQVPRLLFMTSLHQGTFCWGNNPKSQKLTFSYPQTLSFTSRNLTVPQNQYWEAHIALCGWGPFPRNLCRFFSLKEIMQEMLINYFLSHLKYYVEHQCQVHPRPLIPKPRSRWKLHYTWNWHSRRNYQPSCYWRCHYCVTEEPINKVNCIEPLKKIFVVLRKCWANRFGEFNPLK